VIASYNIDGGEFDLRMFVGLGNPGAKYQNHRHNIGFRAIEEIAREHGFSPFRSKFQSAVSEGTLDGTRVILLMPQTFMNLSGQAVVQAAKFYKIAPEDIVVFHDELDLSPGKIKVKHAGGHAGHNGLRSLHQHIGADYWRVRIGIGHPGHKDRVSGYVLHDFAKADADWIDDNLAGMAKGAPFLAAGNGPGFSNALGLATKPNKPAKTEPKKVGNQSSTKSGAARNAPDDRSALQRLVDKFR
jgi:PTH1 family peptidyl-tRNA hydrolase